MKRAGLVGSLISLAFCGPALADSVVVYRPGYFRLAVEAAFVGRVRVDGITPPQSDKPKCGIVYDVTVTESISGATAGAKLHFVADAALSGTAKDDEAFVLLFPHSLPRKGGSECWVEAAPLFASARPASVVPFDRQAGQALDGEFLPVGPENVLTALHFAAIEIALNGKSQRFASWDLVRAYARQTPAVRGASRLLPTQPREMGPPPR
jgi:hypothetical protein